MRQTIFCPFRRRRVALTPEEYVRQNFLARLVNSYGYPASLIAVERPIVVGSVNKRFDALVYSPTMEPLVLIEFKREDVSLSQAVLDQAVTYNRTLQVPYLILSNGHSTWVVLVKSDGYSFLPNIPSWNQLLP